MASYGAASVRPASMPCRLAGRCHGGEQWRHHRPCDRRAQHRLDQGGAGAKGIDTYAKYDATIVNTSNITAIAEAEFGITTALGVFAGGYSSQIVNAAGASIVASASVGSLYGDQYAGIAESFGILVSSSRDGLRRNLQRGQHRLPRRRHSGRNATPIGSSAIATVGRPVSIR